MVNTVQELRDALAPASGASRLSFAIGPAPQDCVAVLDIHELDGVLYVELEQARPAEELRPQAQRLLPPPLSATESRSMLCLADRSITILPCGARQK